MQIVPGCGRSVSFTSPPPRASRETITAGATHSTSRRIQRRPGPATRCGGARLAGWLSVIAWPGVKCVRRLAAGRPTTREGDGANGRRTSGPGANERARRQRAGPASGGSNTRAGLERSTRVDPVLHIGPVRHRSPHGWAVLRGVQGFGAPMDAPVGSSLRLISRRRFVGVELPRRLQVVAATNCRVVRLEIRHQGLAGG